MTWRRRISMLLMGALWAFVYGTFLELARVFFFEKLPKVRRLDELEQQLAQRDEELAIARRAIASHTGVFLGSRHGLEDGLRGAMLERGSPAQDDAVSSIADALHAGGWVLWQKARDAPAGAA